VGALQLRSFASQRRGHQPIADERALELLGARRIVPRTATPDEEDKAGARNGAQPGATVHYRLSWLTVELNQLATATDSLGVKLPFAAASAGARPSRRRRGPRKEGAQGR